MSVKEELYRLLENNEGRIFSGQELAETLGVSRQAVWKAVSKLKNEGFEIETLKNKGYRLIKSGDLLTPQTVRTLLPKELSELQINVYRSVTSTNTIAKKSAAEGAKNGTVIIAEEQTAGRGRRGNSFYSPSRTGLYMSVILRTGEIGEDTDLYTICAGCAVCLAVEELTRCKPLIKWVNDVYLENRKICGILSEATADIEIGHIDSVVIGIGINLSTEGFPAEIREKAGTICANGENVSRAQMAAAVLKNLFLCLKRSREENIRDYKQRSMVLNKEVEFFKNGVRRFGRAVDIDNKGQLVVETESGTEILNSGEISIKSWGVK